MIGVGRDPVALDHVLALGADVVVRLRADECEDQPAPRLPAASGPVSLPDAPTAWAAQVGSPHAEVVLLPGHETNDQAASIAME